MCLIIINVFQADLLEYVVICKAVRLTPITRQEVVAYFAYFHLNFSSGINTCGQSLYFIN